MDRTEAATRGAKALRLNRETRRARHIVGAALDRLDAVLLLPRVASASAIRLPRETLATLRSWL